MLLSIIIPYYKTLEHTKELLKILEPQLDEDVELIIVDDGCKEMIVAVPYELEQGIEEDNIYEIHKQADLTPENMKERYPMLKLLYKNELYGYYIKE